MPEEEVKLSKHSSGVSIIIRLDQIWKNCHSFKRAKRYRDWCEELDSVWLELSRDLFKKKKMTEGDEEFLEVKKEFDKFDERILENGQIKDDKPAGFEDLSPEDIKNRNEHYKILMEKQEFLGRLENHLGKGTTADDEDDDWD